MVKSIIIVDGMSCDHCSNAITKTLVAMPGVSNVTVDLTEKTVTVEHDPVRAELDKIKSEIEEQGYDVIA